MKCMSKTFTRKLFYLYFLNNHITFLIGLNLRINCEINMIIVFNILKIYKLFHIRILNGTEKTWDNILNITQIIPTFITQIIAIK